MKKEWKCQNQDEKVVNYISEKFKVPSLVAKVIANRNFKNDDEIVDFLNPDIGKLYDPYLMEDMNKAVNRIIEAINNKEKILIYGDYDVDGITSITILKKFLQDLGQDVSTYLPNRLDEGYGLNKQALEEIFKMNISLLITVDCGISAIEEVEYARSKSIEIIITDHHECGEQLPNAYAIVNPKRKDSKYTFSQLAGVGVAFKLIQALSIKLNLPKESYLKYIDIACIGTIADIVPLVNENRIIAQNGLEKFKTTKNIGMKKLLQKCSFKKIDSNVISFGLSPRINACGRIGNPQQALDLFLTQNENEAEILAQRLNEANIERQTIERKIFEEAKQIIDSSNMQNDPIIILGHNNWHHGVIGIVASKLVELYTKPCILVCFEGEEGKSSGRGIAGFDLFKAVQYAKEYLIKFGGHEMAIGLTIKKENFESFKQKVFEYTKDNVKSEFINTIKIDAQIKEKDISINNINELKKLEPFGEKNSVPVFLYKNVKIVSIRTLSNEKHLKLELKDNQLVIDAIGFNLGYLSNDFKCLDKVDVIGSLEINEYNNNQIPQLLIRDIMKSI